MKRRRFRRTKKKQSDGAKALRKINKLTRVMKPEIKFVNIVFTLILLNTGAIFSINDVISQGITDQQRIGDKIQLLSLKINGCITQQGSGTNTMARVTLFYDKMNTILVVSDYFQNGAPDIPISERTYDKRREAVQLYDRTFAQNESAMTTGNIVHFKRFVRIDKPTFYDTATTNINVGHLKFLFASDQGVPANQQALRLNARLFYTDT